MNVIDYVVRTSAGTIQRDVVSAGAPVFFIPVAPGSEISFNLSDNNVAQYQRVGDNLQMTLADGRQIILQGYFGGGGAEPTLYLSSDGDLFEVFLAEGNNGQLFAEYGKSAEWGKWSPNEQLIFFDRSDVLATDSSAQNGGEVSMLGAGLLASPALLGLGAAGAAAAGAAYLLNEEDDGSGSTYVPAAPNVDDTAQTLGGDTANQSFEITGTGEPGQQVAVTVGDKTVTTTIAADGTWVAAFEGDTFPADGTYTAQVVVTSPTGQTTLAGPDVSIDFTAPTFDVVDTVVEAGDVVNAEALGQGVTLNGAGEPGASVIVAIDGVSHDTIVADDGTWSVTFLPGEIAAGEYTTDVTITSEDAAGNSSSITRTLEVDSEGYVTFDNAAVGGDDNIVNAAEQADAIDLSGTAEPGSTVVVTIDGTDYPAATADDTGTWTVTLPAGSLPVGEHTVPITVEATDPAGNVSSTDGDITVDTVGNVSISAVPGGADDVVSAAEQTGALTVAGTAEPGSSIDLEIAGTTFPTVTADAAGNWSVYLPAEALPTGETTVPATVTATDLLGNTTTTSAAINIDTVVTPLTADPTAGGSDGVVNAAEAADGITLTGQVEPGSTLIVSLGDASRTATVASDGSWTAAFSAADIPQGDLQSVPVTMFAIDAVGNTTTTTDSIQVDTSAGTLAFDPAPIEGDGIVNRSEAADGVTVTGTATPNSELIVSLGQSSVSVTSSPTGEWTATFAASDVPADADDVAVTATLTDAAGNAVTTSDAVVVDTVVENQAIDAVDLGADNTLSANEAAAGLVISGTTEVGATSVDVHVGGQTLAADVDSTAGTWSVTIPASAIDANDEYSLDLVVETTDAAGNVDQVSQTIDVDTWVNTLTLSPDSSTSDGVVSSSDLAASGLALSGEIEPGSTLDVIFNGATYPATVDASGQWALTIPASDVPSGDYSAPVILSATDPVGNTATTLGSVAIDTVAPDGPNVEFVLESSAGVAGVSLEAQAETQTIYALDSAGGLNAVSHDVPADLGSQTIYTFDSTVPDGSHLVVTSADDVGNTSGTLLVLEDGSVGNSVDIGAPSLGTMNIDTIQLDFADDSALTLTESDILALSSDTNTVMVTGGSDDQVTLAGATQGGTVNDNGQTFVQYTLGEATILVDSDITNVVT